VVAVAVPMVIKNVGVVMVSQLPFPQSHVRHLGGWTSCTSDPRYALVPPSLRLSPTQIIPVALHGNG